MKKLAEIIKEGNLAEMIIAGEEDEDMDTATTLLNMLAIKHTPSAHMWKGKQVSIASLQETDAAGSGERQPQNQSPVQRPEAGHRPRD
jgi:hypothetical protein